MAKYRELMKLIREGRSAQEVVEKMGLSPSLLRRLLECRRMRDEFLLERQLSERLLAHRKACGRPAVFTRMGELLAAEKAETTRRACLDLLALPPESVETDPNTRAVARRRRKPRKAPGAAATDPPPQGEGPARPGGQNADRAPKTHRDPPALYAGGKSR